MTKQYKSRLRQNRAGVLLLISNVLRVRFRNLWKNDGRIRIWRKTHQRFQDASVLQHDRWRAKRFMALGGICADGRTQLIIVPGTLTAATYIRNILQPKVTSFLLYLTPMVMHFIKIFFVIVF